MSNFSTPADGLPRQPARYGARRNSTSSLAIVIAIHGAALAAVMLAKPEVFERITEVPIQTINVDPPEAPPPERADEEMPVEPQTPNRPAVSESHVPSPGIARVPRQPDIPTPPIPDFGDDLASVDPLPPPPPPPPTPAADPIVVAARFHPSHMASLQPRYPSSMLRREVEGSVTVRVRVNEQGRVTAVQKVSAVHDDLFDATRRHAIRSWRFMPATRDGRPVSSWYEATIEFRIT